MQNSKHPKNLRPERLIYFGTGVDRITEIPNTHMHLYMYQGSLHHADTSNLDHNEPNVKTGQSVVLNEQERQRHV